MLVIHFDKNHLLGGYGDRIVGLISIKLISKLLDRNFYICWDKENIYKYINYKKYDFRLLNDNGNDTKTYHLIDNQMELSTYLRTSDNLFPNKINIFVLNQEISQFLYKNKLFSKHNYIHDILSEYKKLYTEILIPTTYLTNRIDKLLQQKSNIVGIQLRCGDFFMETNVDEHHICEDNYDNVRNKLLKIKNICDSDYSNDYYIFYTTDNIKTLQIVREIFDDSKVIYNNDLIQHLDRDVINEDISKVFIDNYILSRRTIKLYISSYSNYGRVAALSSNHDNIYDFDCNYILKKSLLSKHIMLFS